ncbi:acetyl-CoA carboxylase family protein [Zavarzinia compransoris]|uniref:Carbamoyl-phosphate synthase large subunit n=1 Tax=Zavarzinia compransoris TaxID=1264899 RepID=A0A317E8T1_9PROT|nr:carboxyl transferase domain-containing protein [Zavarzinia compransoris]PWR23309.1 carbamoyl-phosphate synthase large subunit [Zavarzinia compransoris]TDP46120.1 biotin-dependent enzyme [Zavarzinia compransoris]
MFRRILIANRGEIAIRIARAAAALGSESVAVHGADDARSLHVAAADRAVALPGAGVAAYLDGAALIAAAKAEGCDALHPGYGFLAENAGFAAAVLAAGIAFIGPTPETLALFGDKLAARRLAEENGVPVIEGTTRATGLGCAEAFMRKLGPEVPVMVKAAAGGGGRGMRVVRAPAELAEAFARCASEAKAAFGDDALFVERFIPAARHVEIQILGDGTGAVGHLFERDCSLQRRHQKLVEIAPAPGLPPETRARLIEAALTLGRAARYRTLGTVEFLVAPDGGDFWFIEANPRLQVEHTVTEAVTGVDLVAAQIRLAAGEALGALDLDGVRPRGCAVQLRVNLEIMDGEGGARPAAGTIAVYEMPGGPGIRVDGAGYAGYAVNPGFDPLIAKLIVHQPGGFAPAIAAARKALAQARIEGVASNLGFLERLLAEPEIAAGTFDNRWIERNLSRLATDGTRAPGFFAGIGPVAAAETIAGPAGTQAIPAPLSGRIVALEAEVGAAVAAGQPLAVLEAMKMEHVVKAPVAGILRQWGVEPGATIAETAPLAFIEPVESGAAVEEAAAAIDPEHIRPDLAEVIARHAPGLDANRPAAVARRARTGQRTARANVEDLLDPGSFIEYGALLLPAQRRRRGLDDLIENGPADGLITGIGTVNASAAGPERARTMVLAYDYTVMAGTQGMMNHKKTDRVLHLAREWRLPVVLFAEGGGGRPGDTDWVGVAGLDVPTFATYAALSGEVPTIGIVSGYSFAGNAALLGCSDLIVATRNASFGMAGPAMIEGGGLGVFRPDEVGPAAMQWANGNIDLLVDDEAAAVAATRRLLGYFQGPVPGWAAADQRMLRHVVPENRLRVYDIREAIRLLADTGSVTELRAGFGRGLITALIRIEGRPHGLIANDPRHLGGAIDAPAAEKGARFLKLCEGHRLPVVSLVDTPGFMVGPACEAEGMVRKAADLFVAGARLTVPVAAVVLRKGYGLGAQAMTAGSFHRSVFTIAWPSGEFGGMGLEGAVRLGYRRELEAEPDPAAQKALFDRLVAQQYANGKGINMASFGEIDAVIDPAETRAWIVRGIGAIR